MLVLMLHYSLKTASVVFRVHFPLSFTAGVHGSTYRLEHMTLAVTVEG